ncbi:MAG: peptidoglycan bridge formation glycyltransferase FemA/FemB family protein [Planctomycetes bacterium]|nr:peptidoglycan bridge formation glycyltransferase FemA/FemB family protein [Planctomycetota bacterium]
MNQLTVKSIDRKQWLTLVKRFSDFSYRQDWVYANALAERRRAISVNVVIEGDGELLGLANVRVKNVPLGLGGLAYVSWGPIVWQDKSDHHSRYFLCMNALRDEFVKRRNLLLRVDIQPALREPILSENINAPLAEIGFTRATNVQQERTLIVDLNYPEETLRSQLAQKWRNCLNQAQRNGLTIRTGNSSEIMQEFSELFNTFIKHKQFSVDLDAEFFASVQQSNDHACRFDVALAEINGHVVAGEVTSMLGDTCIYLLGATEKEGLKTKASYMLQWNAITTAKERGFRWYDLGGIDPITNPGVYHFKKGLGGKDVFSPGVFEATPSGVMGNVMQRAVDLHYKRQERKKSRVVQRAK